MDPGDVWLVQLPVQDGREQAGQRPAVILQDDHYAGSSPLVLVASLTSQLSALRFPGTVSVDPDENNGLTSPSVALIFQTRAVDRKRFVRRLGSLTKDNMSAVYEELDRVMGRDNPFAE